MKKVVIILLAISLISCTLTKKYDKPIPNYFAEEKPLSNHFAEIEESTKTTEQEPYEIVHDIF